MENLFIEGTNTLPTVEFNTNGTLKIEGRALPENAHDFFKPLIAWVKEFSIDELKIEMILEYYNTSVSKQLYDFLKVIENNENYKTINLIWSYEEGDDEIQESGEIYDELLPRINFEYNCFAEVFDD